MAKEKCLFCNRWIEAKDLDSFEGNPVHRECNTRKKQKAYRQRMANPPTSVGYGRKHKREVKSFHVDPVQDVVVVEF